MMSACTSGRAAIAHLQLGDVFDRPDVTLVPALDANAASNGVMKRTAFDYIESTILQTVQEHLSELDGIYLHLHGASEVEGIGSGDHHILKEVRRIVGPYMPIAVVCDPHGNLCKEYVEGTTLIRSYRESPHTDVEQTIRFGLLPPVGAVGAPPQHHSRVPQTAANSGR